MSKKPFKINRKKGTYFCEYCGEPKGLGRHAIEEDLAERIIHSLCPNCKSDTKACCILGIGHFVYFCEKCGKKWTSIEE